MQQSTGDIDWLAQARAFVARERLADAEQCLKTALRVDPGNHAAIHLLAQLACQCRRHDIAEPLMAEAVRLAPDVAEYRITMGRAQRGLGRLEAAETAFRHALQIDPGQADAHVLIGLLARGQGRLDDAAAAYRAALAIRPAYPEAQVNLANLLRERGEADDAAALYRQAADAAPGLAAAQNALVATLVGQGREKEALDRLRNRPDQEALPPQHQFLRGLLSQQQGGPAAEAIEAYGRVLAQFPDHADSWVNLGLALAASGQPDGGMRCYRRALEIEPDHLAGLINSGLALSAYGAMDEALARLRRAVELKPDHADAQCNLGAVLLLDGRLAEAEQVMRAALALAPDFLKLKANLGAALRTPGRVHESIAVLRDVLAADPYQASAQDNLLLSLLYADGISAAEIADTARRFAADDRAVAEAPRPAARQGRLRIGYVSPDLRRHSVAYFVEPVIERHDRERFEVFCYHLSPIEDDVTQRLRGHADHWRNVHGLPAAALAAQVRADGIDILVDLAGRTAHHCLAAFAERPAPLQFTWLGFPSTVGVAAIGYRITDWQVDPPGYEPFNVETPLRLPHSYFCYRPGAAPAIAPVPREAPVFGSFNNVAKISAATIALWAAVLRAVPEAGLLLKNKMFAEEATRNRVADAFAAAGVDPARLELRVWLPDIGGHLDLYNRIDVALDTFPYNGATTTCEALWMGVPVVSRCGETHAARMGRSILCAAGLPELVADDDATFVAIAARLARDRAHRAVLRATLRERLQASPLMDEVAYTRAIEQCYFDTCRAATADSPIGSPA